VPAAFGIHRHAGRGQRFDIAQHRAAGDLEPVGQLAGRDPLAGLQQEQHGEQPRRLHVENLSVQI
jgi:hypothetical protein